MTKGQLVKIKAGVDRILMEESGLSSDGMFVILRGPYEGIFKDGQCSRLLKVVDLLTPAGQICEKIACEYLERV